MSQSGVSSSAGDTISVPSAGKMPSLAGRERINEEKTSYASYPRAKKGTDPKEVVIGVGAAFQKEIKKTICGISLDDVLRNVKAGIEEEGMIPRVVKILDTSDVCFMALEAAKLSGSGIGIGNPVQRNDGHPPERPLPALQSGAVPAGAAHDARDIPPDRTERGEICERRTGRSDPLYKRSDVQTALSGEGGDHAHRRDRAA